jgi:ribosomal protein S18 acetylase RimI-like enzyme
VKIDFKKISHFADLESIWRLYCTSFPPEERRGFEDLKQLVSVKECFVNEIITDNKEIAGLCVFWMFEKFVFVEHFAIFPGMRNNGIGGAALLWLRKNYPLILLETELPTNETSRRRIKFFQRNGFHVLDRPYFQPSYGNKKPEVELKIMCSMPFLADEILNEYIIQIKHKVYHQIDFVL